MQIDIFSELQKARPWPENHEAAIWSNALEQAKLADKLGYGCWWNVEHHGAVEFSWSSAPELFPVAAAQHTKNLRFGHSGILALKNINHPVRIAERAAWADLMSNGRLELGLARSGGTEWETFGVDGETSREQVREAMRMIPRMWTEESFSWKSDLYDVPEKNIIPKPVQQPHPPLWQTTSSPESFEMAGELGVGALCTTLLTPLDGLRFLFGKYDEGLARCKEPAGKFLNNQRACFTFVHCRETRQDAVESLAGEAALWFVNAAPQVFRVPRSIWINAIRGSYLSGNPTATAAVESDKIITDEDVDDPVPVIRLLNRHLAGVELDPEEVYDVLEAEESVVIGDVDTCRKKMQGFADVGVDRLMCLMQFGTLKHEEAMESIRVVGENLIPEFAK